MSRSLHTDAATPATNHDVVSSHLLLQRKCACGQHTVAGGECAQCRQKRLRLQRRANDQAVPFSFDGKNPSPTYGGEDLSHLPLHRTQTRMQCMPQASTETSAPDTAAAGPAPETAAPETAAVETASNTAPTTGLIVEDTATELGPGQMRKSDFLAQTKAAVCTAAEEALAETGRNTEGCPYLEYWFDYYGDKDSHHIERAMRRYAPETATAPTAAALIPVIAERVRQGVAAWAQTGEITGVPEGIPATLPGSPPAEDTASSLQRKAPQGSASPTQSPQAIRARLGDGRALDGPVRSRMEGAFGTSFAGVRLHTDNQAANLSRQVRARAFTVGEHVAFNTGEYRPGTLVGDALIAHELAHVIQQGGSSTAVASKGDHAQYNNLEDDADQTAVGAVLSLWQGATAQLANIAPNAIPTLKSGLRLQRCNEDDEVNIPPEKKEEPVEEPVKEEPVKEEKPPEKKEEPVETPLPAEPSEKCTADTAADKVIIDHRVKPDVIEKPGDTVTFTATFACVLKGDGYSKFVPSSGTEFGRKSFAKGLGRLTRTWDGKKLHSKVGTYLVDDGQYFHEIEPIKYTIKGGKDFFTTGPKHKSPPVKVKAREHKGSGKEHFHFTPANVAALAKVIETEMGGETDKAKQAVAWAVRNQMVRLSTSDVATAAKHFKDRDGKTASATSKTMAEEILKKPMSDDITQGAIKWFSPNAQPKEGEGCSGEGCGGGLDAFTDEAGKERKVHTPSFHKDMTYVPIDGIHEWRVRFYKL